MNQDLSQLSDEELEELLIGDSSGGYGYPKPIPKDTIFRFFRQLLRLTDNKKVGNLSAAELGNLGMTVRGYLDVANYCKTEGLDTVAEYFNNKAEIVLQTSLSKKGFLPQLFVTQVRKEQKIKTQNLQEKKGWFSSKQPRQEE